MLWQVTRADVPQREELDSYVLVQKDDVLDAIGTFVAAYLAELPEAQNLQPAQLQAALKTAFKVSMLPCCYSSTAKQRAIGNSHPGFYAHCNVQNTISTDVIVIAVRLIGKPEPSGLSTDVAGLQARL